jgi:small subunit ribosomal protein S4e
MANKGETKCLKIFNVGRVHKINKSKIFVLRPSPGKHNLKTTVSIGYVIRDLLHLADNKKEINYIIQNREIIVDKKIVKSKNMPVGFYDIIEIPKLKKYYKVTFKENGEISLIEIKEEETKYKLCKIISKKLVKKGEIQLKTNDGRTILTTNNAYKTKATIKYDFEDNTIKEYIPLELKKEAFIVGGRHIGKKATIIEIKESRMNKPSLIRLKTENEEIETTEKNVFVIN